MIFGTTLLLSVLFWTTTLAGPMSLEQRAGTCQQCVSSPNNCDITAPCSSFLNAATGLNKLYCGCRPGYKASNTLDTDTTRQWRLNFPGHQHRVWVAPGVVCDQLCANPFGGNPCSEVSFVDQCKP